MNALFIILTTVTPTPAPDPYRQAMLKLEWLEYLTKSLGYFSAIALTVILILVSLMMAVDVLYLLVPAAKEAYDDYVNSQQGLAKVVSRLLVSKNAMESFEDSAVTNQPVLWCYMKRSIKFFIIVTIVVFILATGLDTILVFMYKLLSGLLA